MGPNQNLTNLNEVAGDWWVVKGQNCGQEGWPSGFDWYPCQGWITAVTYTGWFDQNLDGTVSTCFPFHIQVHFYRIGMFVTI